jgi:AAA+ superfamily predicted ATPase
MSQRSDSLTFFSSANTALLKVRRVLNSFLQFIEQDMLDSIVIAATNNQELLDKALFRRFDDVLYYNNPTDEEKQQLIENVLGTFKPKDFMWDRVIENSSNLCHAELVSACLDAVKNAVLADEKKVSDSDLCDMINNREGEYHVIETKVIS